MKIDILGVKIDKVNQTEALDLIEKWVWNPGKHYVVTPNPEFILAAQKDDEFKKILNNANLAIPDSSSLGFSYWLLKRSKLERVFLWPFFFIPLKQLIPFDRVAGTDLVEVLCKTAAEKGFTVGFLGGADGVAKKTAECLQKKYPKLKVAFAELGGKMDLKGNILVARGPASSVWESFRLPFALRAEPRRASSLASLVAATRRDPLLAVTPRVTDSNFVIPPIDILFVAFGHIKQEKWIAKNLEKIPVHVAIGVGGAFDYLSNNVPRAPKLLRNLGFEWLFRLIIQPWRIRRQLALLQYIWLLVKA